METIVIIGASRGIGAELTKEFARGNKLILVARSLDKLNQLTEYCRNEAIEVDVIPCDLTKEDELDLLIDKLKSIKIDRFIYNAGSAYAKNFEDMYKKEIDMQLKVNAIVPTELTHSLLDRFKTDKTHIVFICSIASYLYGPRVSIYFASKNYLKNLSYSLYEELKPYGIWVTTIHPGFVSTEMLSDNIGNNKLPKLIVQSPQDIAKQIHKTILKKRRSAILGKRNVVLILLSKFLVGSLWGSFFYKYNKKKVEGGRDV